MKAGGRFFEDPPKLRSGSQTFFMRTNLLFPLRVPAPLLHLRLIYAQIKFSRFPWRLISPQNASSAIQAFCIEYLSPSPPLPEFPREADRDSHRSIKSRGDWSSLIILPSPRPVRSRQLMTRAGFFRRFPDFQVHYNILPPVPCVIALFFKILPPPFKDVHP